MAIRIIAARQVVSSPEPRSIAARIWSACEVLGSSMRSAATNSSRLVLVPRTSSNDAKYASASATDSLTASGFLSPPRRLSIGCNRPGPQFAMVAKLLPLVKVPTARSSLLAFGRRSVTLGRGRVPRAARAHHEDSPSGQPRRTLRGWCGLSRPTEGGQRPAATSTST